MIDSKCTVFKHQNICMYVCSVLGAVDEKDKIFELFEKLTVT